MQDISLHILDIAENSIRAGATKIIVDILENPVQDLLGVRIIDNGPGMDQETIRKAMDPFYTSKPGKRIGLGISLLAQAAREGGGELKIESKPGDGVALSARFGYNHPDRKPLGDIEGTMKILSITHPEIDFVYLHEKGEE